MRKENRTYYFSVEGETEKWYLDWLQGAINADPAAKYTVKLNSKIQKDPLARAKGLTNLGKTEITHKIHHIPPGKLLIRFKVITN